MTEHYWMVVRSGIKGGRKALWLICATCSIDGFVFDPTDAEVDKVEPFWRGFMYPWLDRSRVEVENPECQPDS